MADKHRKLQNQTIDILPGKGEKRYPSYLMWKEFDKEMDSDLSKILEGSFYFRTILSLIDRQIVDCAMLAATRTKEELRLQVNAALNRGCNPKKIVKAFLQVATYAGMAAVNEAFEIYKEVLKERREWPIKM